MTHVAFGSPSQSTIVPPPQLPHFEDRNICKVLLRLNKRETVACAAPCPSFAELVEHQDREHHMPAALACIPCELRFDKKKSADAHMRHCPANIACLVCPIRFKTHDGMQKHMSVVHSGYISDLPLEEYKRLNSSRVCPSCNKMFATPRGMKQHLNRGKCVPRPPLQEGELPSAVPLTRDASLTTSAVPLAGDVASTASALPLAGDAASTISALPLVREVAPPSPPLSTGMTYDPTVTIGTTSIRLPQYPTYPEPHTYERLFPGSQSEIPSAARCGEPVRLNFSQAVPLSAFSPEDLGAGALALSYRCKLCNYAVVSDMGQLLHHQSSCKRVNIGHLNHLQWIAARRCYYCGRQFEEREKFGRHFQRCEAKKYNPDSPAQWHGPPMPPPPAV